VCNNQQKDIETKIKSVGSSERKKDKILSSIDKSSFLSKLKNVDDENNSDSEFRINSSIQVLIKSFYFNISNLNLNELF
jgi:hypothetical protein